MASHPGTKQSPVPRHHRRASSGGNRRVIEDPILSIAPQIIYIHTTPPKRPKTLKHANTFPPDKKSNPKPIPVKSPPAVEETSRKRSTSSIASERPARVSRKRTAPSESLQPERQNPERAVKRAKHTIVLPISPPETPEKRIAENLVHPADTHITEISLSDSSLPMSPPSSPPLPTTSDAANAKITLLRSSPSPSKSSVVSDGRPLE